MDRYSLRERIFLVLSIEKNYNSLISVHRAYHEEFEYKKTPSAATGKR